MGLRVVGVGVGVGGVGGVGEGGVGGRGEGVGAGVYFTSLLLLLLCRGACGRGGGRTTGASQRGERAGGAVWRGVEKQRRGGARRSRRGDRRRQGGGGVRRQGTQDGARRAGAHHSGRAQGDAGALRRAQQGMPQLPCLRPRHRARACGAAVTRRSKCRWRTVGRSGAACEVITPRLANGFAIWP